MNKKIKLLIVFLIVVFAVLIVNEFVLFTSIDSERTAGSSASCIMPSLEDVQYFDYVVVGTAESSEWVTYKREVVLSDPENPISELIVIDGEEQGEVVEREFIKTDTVFNLSEVLKGDLSSNEIVISVAGGCDVRRNFCTTSSNTVHLEEGKDYLLFLHKLPKEGFVAPLPITDTFGGFNSCTGIYVVELDSNGNVYEDTVLFLGGTFNDDGEYLNIEVTYKDLVDFLEGQ